MADRLMVGQRPLEPRIEGSSPSLPALMGVGNVQVIL